MNLQSYLCHWLDKGSITTAKLIRIGSAAVQFLTIYQNRLAMSREKSSAIKGSLQGNLFLLNEDQQSFTSAQIELLIAIGDCGSITRAAKQAGISYKTAWDRIDAMNNLSDKPLVTRATGGAKGGGTKLTEFGQDIIHGFTQLQDEHAAFIDRLGASLHSMGDLAKFLRSTTLHTSARNQFRGKVTKITRGSVNTEVELSISNTARIVAHVTNASAKKMKLKKDSYAIALIKSSWIILSKDNDLATSARNKLTGSITKIVKGGVNSEVSIDLGDDKSLCSVITNGSVKELNLKKGDQACALFKASSVILMAD